MTEKIDLKFCPFRTLCSLGVWLEGVVSSGGFVVLLAQTRGEKPFSFFRTQCYASSTFLVGCMRDVLQDMLNAVTRQRKPFCFVCV